MTRTRRKRWRGFVAAMVVAAGAAATVAIAHSAAGLVSTGLLATKMAAAEEPDEPAEGCTRYAALSLAAAQGIRQGRVEKVASPRLLVVGTIKGTAVRMTLENAGASCRIVRVDML